MKEHNTLEEYIDEVELGNFHEVIDRIIDKEDCGPELPSEAKKLDCEIDLLVPKLGSTPVEEHAIRQVLIQKAKDSSNLEEQQQAIATLWEIYRVKIVDPKEYKDEQ